MAWRSLSNSASASITSGVPIDNAASGILKVDPSAKMLYISIGNSEWIGLSVDTVAYKVCQGSGSLSLGGTAAYAENNNYSFTGTGSLLLSGSASIDIEKEYDSSGSLLLSGAGPVAVE